MTGNKMKLSDYESINETTYHLPRGGYLVETPAGYVQFGSPPETIKDTMSLPGSVPEIFVLPDNMFNWLKGISIAEIEFPLYYNFFIRKKKTLIICRKEQFSRIRRVLQESLFGPELLNLEDDFDSSLDKKLIPNLKNEIDYFRNGNKLSNMVQFGLFENNKFSCKGITISIDDKNNFVLLYNKEKLAEVPGRIDYKATYMIGERLAEPYLPPLFGVTCLGPSHGFDPEENTSGFIIWLNHQGIMVDPPVNSTEWLEDSNVSPKFIDSIILTHCHADHDAGTFQKILEEGKVTVYTTETVMMSFLRKYSALSDVEPDYLMRLFDFHPIKIGRPIYINGGKFDIFYTLHSIPTIGFRMEFQDQSFVYSSDHNNDPELHNKLYDENIIVEERYNELKNFPWDSRVIYHESGVPPLHTPIKLLNAMPEDIKKRVVIYHIAKKDFPEDSALKLAEFGMENTLYFETEPPANEEAYRILSVFKRLDFMHDMPIWKAQEFIDIVQIQKFSKGERIIEKGTKGSEFYIIYAGNISVESDGLERDKIYGPYDYFGELALITDQTRAAHVHAETDVILFTIEKDKFLNFIVGTEFEKILKRVAAVRSAETWNLLSTSSFFQYFTSTQKTWLESMLVPREIKGPSTLIKEDEPFTCLYLIREGTIEVSMNGKFIATLKRGDFVGSLNRVHKGLNAKYTYSSKEDLSVFAMASGDLCEFLKFNPGPVMKFSYDFQEK